MNDENTLNTNSTLSIFIALSVSLVAQYIYLSSNRLMLSHSGGGEGALLLPFINGIFLPFLFLANYSNIKIIHKLLHLSQSKYSKIIAVIVPFWSVIYVPVVLVLYPLLYQ